MARTKTLTIAAQESGAAKGAPVGKIRARKAAGADLGAGTAPRTAHEAAESGTGDETMVWRGADGDERTLNGALSVKKSVDVAMVQVHPGAFNPRRRFDEAAILDLAQSIDEHGLMQALVVRPVEDGYEIVAGERRFRALKLLGWTSAPCTVRTLEDQAAALMAIVENIQRADLSPFEEGSAYAALRQEHGMSVEAIAERVHRSRSAVSNTMRLLDLPEAVRSMIEAGELSEAHGRALLRWAPFERVMTTLAQIAVDRGLTSRTLEGDTDWNVIRELEDAGAIVRFDPRDFDQHVCEECPFGARLKIGEHTEACFKPEHYTQLTAEATEARERETALEAARKVGAKELMVNEARANLDNARRQMDYALQRREIAAASGDKVGLPEAKENFKAAKVTVDDALTILEMAQKAKEAAGERLALRNVSTLPGGTYVEIQGDGDYYGVSRPPECSEDCACDLKVIGRWGTASHVCTDRGRWNVLKGAATRDAAKSRRTAFERMLADAQVEIWATLPLQTDRVAAAVALSAIGDYSVDIRRGAAKRLRQEMGDSPFPAWLEALDVLGSAASSYGEEKDGTKKKALQALGAGFAMRFAAECLVRKAIADALERRSDVVPLVDFLTGVSRETAQVIPTDPPVESGDRRDGDALPGDGESGDAGIGMGDAMPGEAIACMSCGQEFPYPDGEPSSQTQDGRSHWPHCVNTSQGGWYCAKCVIDGEVVFCRKCGCTDEAGCEGGCSWIEDDLCSACADGNGGGEDNG